PAVGVAEMAHPEGESLAQSGGELVVEHAHLRVRAHQHAPGMTIFTSERLEDESGREMLSREGVDGLAGADPVEIGVDDEPPLTAFEHVVIARRLTVAFGERLPAGVVVEANVFDAVERRR